MVGSRGKNLHRGQVSQILDALGVPNSLADNGRFLADADAFPQGPAPGGG